MKALVIGGTGHIGLFLTEMLVEDGYEVLVASSGRLPFPESLGARGVRHARLNYREALADPAASRPRRQYS